MSLDGGKAVVFSVLDFRKTFGTVSDSQIGGIWTGQKSQKVARKLAGPLVFLKGWD